jgi:Lrp/AsnC family transcriptional regulator, leucine-responsive regulatory protein
VLATDMKDLEAITSDLARIGSITTDLVYEVVADRPTPPARGRKRSTPSVFGSDSDR